MRQRILVLLAILFAAGTCPGVALAATASPTQLARPTEPIEPANCVTSDCHADIKQYKALHGPVNVNTCDACHELVDAKAHTFRFMREGAELCTYCHEFDTGQLPVVHAPVIKGECTGCHDPHGGGTPTLLRGQSIQEMCQRCHESLSRDRSHLHTPVSKGQCDACHTSHASKYPKLVNAAGSDLCITCHTDLHSQLARAKFRHEAIDEGCSKCHDVHGSNTAMALTQPVPDLCIECHQDIQQQAENAKYKHTVVMADRACITCHTSHGSELAGLMRDLPAVICMDCHSGKAQAEGGRIVTAVSEINDPNLRKHGPIEEGQCNGCHGPHGTDREMLLTLQYSRSFYQKFAPEHYDLCFSCHDSKLVQQENGQDVTHFRNGQTNLHYVHVIKGNRGRSCGVCHSTHAGTNDRHVREWVPFGKWKVPINFQRTPTGGTCFSGCHATYAYDREKPVLIPTTGPATQPAPMVPLPDHDQPILVNWTGQDIAARPVKVPHTTRTTVMLFLRAEENATAPHLFKLINAGLDDASRVQVLVILGGDQAEQRARTLADSQIIDWPVIADPEYRLARQLGVYVWPATLVIQSDSKQIAHIGGTPQSLSNDLAAYLDFAAGKLDRTALNQRLAANRLLHEQPNARAARQLRIAERMLQEGHLDRAKRLLEDALKHQPQSIPLQVGLIKVLAQEGQAKQAFDLLNKLPAGAMPAAQLELLRGQLLIAMQKWTEAKRALLAAIDADSQLPDAHYLLGQIYEREKDWARAAQEYRAAHEAREQHTP